MRLKDSLWIRFAEKSVGFMGEGDSLFVSHDARYLYLTGDGWANMSQGGSLCSPSTPKAMMQ